ncbi:MAG: hypothetical protein P8H87_03535 [Flavobacteriaceae bacterium]|nr:hypothetical protein [Flavobacteriaceae bacterium]
MKKSILFLVLFTQCNGAIEYPTPNLQTPDPPKENSSIQAVWERVQQSETGYVRFEKDETTLWLSGYVSSSDATGNFSKNFLFKTSLLTLQEVCGYYWIKPLCIPCIPLG